MVNFGEKLITTQYVPWALHYIDYQHLKQVLEEEYHDVSASGKGMDNKSIATATWTIGGSTAANNNNSQFFLSVLYHQTEKVAFFVLQEQGRITSTLDECRQELLKGASEMDELVQLEGTYVETGIALLRLIRFVDLNMQGFRKILKKHDKVARSKLSLSYLTLRNSESSTAFGIVGYNYARRLMGRDDEKLDWILWGNQLLQPLLQVDTFTALAGAYEAGTEELRRLWVQYELNHTPATALAAAEPRISKRHLTAPNLQSMMLQQQQEPSPQQRETSYYNDQTNQQPSHSVSGGDLKAMMLEEERALRRTTTMSPSQVLLQIHAARGRLHHTNEFIRLLAAPMMVTTPEDVISESGSKTSPMMNGRPSRLSNLLNLLSTFFYMTNYYIVAPTSANYADKLGSDSSIASIIIGMTSVAALVSTLLYSWWTSYSYKSALIFASTCSVVGNMLYAAGLPCQSLEIVMLGRLLNGFGSARSINRRYIADSFSQADRTTASAAFVTATAAGMATGPALASILHVATEESTSVYWQSENAPGVFMFFVWIIFLFFLIFYFEEPVRPYSRKNTSSDDNKQQQNGTLSEKKPLLAQSITPDAPEEEEESGSLCCNVPVMVTLVVYMVLKMVLEAVLSSESNLTTLYFDWESDISGVHLTILALLILPVNFGVAFLARSYFDRELIIGLLVGMFVGCIVILQYQHDPEDYTLAQYLIGSALLFVCASALEAPNMSLLSKVIPRKWSRGIINVGLLATESGTLGRVIGDVLLAAVGSRGMEELLNRAFGWYSVIIFGTLLLTFATYERLVEPPEPDDD
ncbi:SPX domain-containing membrane protein OsI [Seminavis robusta]|uniref:SPX domain-containing membrane protein OsI n=1 Tax=Seminavis robusta TaxID=568900 RepID=A0A9N8EKQ3_9STRA|nr:SPX domain-containing membrane protein OsI [Seminavis robusta]|eukprot:Sro1241_g255420.1 SPX domain-containing membrane protein OsI (809) ;mRNA; r:10348-13013